MILYGISNQVSSLLEKLHFTRVGCYHCRHISTKMMIDTGIETYLLQNVYRNTVGLQ